MRRERGDKRIGHATVGGGTYSTIAALLAKIAFDDRQAGRRVSVATVGDVT